MGALRTAIITAGGVAAAGWLGLRVPPRPFPPAPPGRDLGTAEGSNDLPESVRRHLAVVYGSERLPRVETLTMWGTGRMRLGPGPWWPMRARTCHVIGRRFAGHFEAAWSGFPVLKAIESHESGTGRSYLPWPTTTGPGLDQSSTALMWVEAGMFATEPGIHGARWEATDGTSARLVVPREPGEDVIVAMAFDPATGLVRRIETERSKGPDTTPVPWRADVPGWHRFRSLLVPDRVSITWEDEGTPWIHLDLTGAAINTDVGDCFPQPPGDVPLAEDGS